MNKVVHFEIPAKDVERARDFYTNVFDWDIRPFQMEDTAYNLATTVPVDKNMMPTELGGINGALMERDGLVKAPVLTIEVPDIKDHIKIIEDNGGKMLTSVQRIAEMGLYVRFRDTEGNIMAIWQNLPRKNN